MRSLDGTGALEDPDALVESVVARGLLDGDPTLFDHCDRGSGLYARLDHAARVVRQPLVEHDVEHDGEHREHQRHRPGRGEHEPPLEALPAHPSR